MANSVENERLRVMNQLINDVNQNNQRARQGKKGWYVIFFSGLIISVFVHPIIKKLYSKQPTFTLRTESEFFKLWNNCSYGHDIYAYVFNVINPEGFAKGENLIFEEIGPFVYHAQPKEFDGADLFAENTRLSQFHKTVDYLFDKEKSNGLSENDNLTVLNFMALGIPSAVTKANTDLLLSATRTVHETMKRADPLFVNTTTRTILLDGIEEFLEGQIQDNPEEHVREYSDESSENVCNEKDKKIDAFGNCEDEDDEYFYEENEKSHITGRSIYHDRHDDHDTNNLNGAFASQNFTYYFDSTVELPGFTAKRFITSMGSDIHFKLGDECSYSYSGRCLEDYGYVLSRYYNTILFVSNPHFYTSSSDHVVEGFNPEKKKHMMFCDVDPRDQKVVRFHYRIQYNLVQIKNSNVTVLPLLWIDEVQAISDSNLEIMRRRKSYEPYIFGFIIVVGILIGLIGYVKLK